jgi:hypothetical protein
MPSILNEAFEWLDRAEQAREVAGQLNDPSARKAVLELAESFDRLARAAATPAVLRRRELATKDHEWNWWFPPRVPQSTAKAPREVEKHGSAQSNANSRGELQDLLIDRFVEHRQAVAEGQEERVKAAEAEIDSLLREKEKIEKWAVAGSA